MQYCSKCGAKLRKNAKFCHECGTRVRDISKAVKTESIDSSYERWKKKGRISLRLCDVLSLIGLFIFGWLILVVYERAGKWRTGLKFFIPIILLWVLGYRVSFIFGLIGIALYIYAWYSIRKTIKGYHEKYYRELHEREIVREVSQEEISTEGRETIRKPEFKLGLADPDHPARKEIDQASTLASEVVSLFVGGFSCHSGDAMRLVSLIDNALEKSPNDLDLLVAKSGALCLALKFKTAEEVLDKVLSIDPNHFEATQRRLYPDKWPHLFAYPPWSESTTTLHSIILNHLQRKFILQIIRDGLQTGIGIFRPATMSQFPKGLTSDMRCKWQPLWSETPYGPIIAHYTLIEDDPENPYVAEAFLNPSITDEVNPFSGYWLIRRLTTLSSCFVVLTDGHKILYNRRFVFPDSLRRELKTISERILEERPRLDEKTWRSAIQWHTQHFNMKNIRF